MAYRYESLDEAVTSEKRFHQRERGSANDNFLRTWEGWRGKAEGYYRLVVAEEEESSTMENRSDSRRCHPTRIGRDGDQRNVDLPFIGE